jgi:prophage regulatory protein
MFLSDLRSIRLLRLPEVMNRVGLSRSTVDLYVKRGEFPAPVKLGSRSVAWNSEDIDAWIQEKLEGSTIKENHRPTDS